MLYRWIIDPVLATWDAFIEGLSQSWLARLFDGDGN